VDPPDKLLQVSPQTQKIAEEQKAHQVTHGLTMMFAGIAVLGKVGDYAPRTARTIGDLAWGFKISPLSSPRPTAQIKMTPSGSWQWGLPPPLGIMPPEYYGASPTYLGDAFPILPTSSYLATATTPERAQDWAAKKQHERLENEVLGFLSTFGRDELLKQHQAIAALPQFYRVQGTTLEFQTRIVERELRFHKFDFGNIGFITQAEAIELQTPKVAPVYDASDGRQTATVAVQPVLPQPNAAPVPQASFSTNTVKAITLLALGAAKAAKSIAKELVTERADP